MQGCSRSGQPQAQTRPRRQTRVPEGSIPPLAHMPSHQLSSPPGGPGHRANGCEPADRARRVGGRLLLPWPGSPSTWWRLPVAMHVIPDCPSLGTRAGEALGAPASLRQEQLAWRDPGSACPAADDAPAEPGEAAAAVCSPDQRTGPRKPAGAPAAQTGWVLPLRPHPPGVTRSVRQCAYQQSPSGCPVLGLVAVVCSWFPQVPECRDCSSGISTPRVGLCETEPGGAHDSV